MPLPDGVAGDSRRAPGTPSEKHPRSGPTRDEITTAEVARFRADLVGKDLGDKRINNILAVPARGPKAVLFVLSFLVDVHWREVISIESKRAFCFILGVEEELCIYPRVGEPLVTFDMAIVLDFLAPEHRPAAVAAMCQAFRLQRPDFQRILRLHFVESIPVRQLVEHGYPKPEQTYVRALAHLQGETQRQLAAQFDALGEWTVCELIEKVLKHFDEPMIGRVVAVASETD